MLIERSWEGERDAPPSDRAIPMPKPRIAGKVD